MNIINEIMRRVRARAFDTGNVADVENTIQEEDFDPEQMEEVKGRVIPSVAAVSDEAEEPVGDDICLAAELNAP